MEMMFLPLKRFADFQGRSSRMEYWLFILFYTLVFVACGVLAAIGIAMSPNADLAAVGTGTILFWAGAALGGGFALAMVIPGLAVQVRRFHDQDRSGWMLLLGLIPYVGGIVVLVFMCLEGTRGSNRFGANPKVAEGDLQSVFN